MTQSVLLLAVSAALLLLVAVILLLMGIDLGVEEVAKHRHAGYIVDAGA